jgi:hypothetical protein
MGKPGISSLRDGLCDHVEPRWLFTYAAPRCGLYRYVSLGTRLQKRHAETGLSHILRHPVMTFLRVWVLTAHLCFPQVDNAGIDILLVGDSVAMVVHGHDTTLPVTLDEMILHCKAVSRGAHRCAP